MNIAFYSGVSGLMAYQEGLNVIAHNVANVNTDGYKPTTEAFRDLIYTNMDTNGEPKELLGHGVRGIGTDLKFSQGNIRATENPLDYAIVAENGIFALQNGETTKYTRNGSFGISVEEDGRFLASKTDGSYVLDGEGERIEIPYKTGLDDKGKVTQTAEIDYSALIDRIGVYTVPNPFGLNQTDGACFMTNNLSGAAVALEGNERDSVSLLSNTLESSKVDLADEMVNVMKTQKAYQLSAKIVQTADQIEEIVNSLR